MQQLIRFNYIRKDVLLAKAPLKALDYIQRAFDAGYIGDIEAVQWCEWLTLHYMKGGWLK